MLTVVLSCEHAGNEIPPPYRVHFENASEVLASHQGWDIGAFELAMYFSNVFPLFFYSKTSRLLIELNRSPKHPKLFSTYTKTLPANEKEIILLQHYEPYRSQVISALEELIAKNQKVLHLSVHTFTPVLDNKIRATDIGLLYDPKRQAEKQFCTLWKKSINERSKQYRVRFNYPYLGKSDGFVTYLRKKFGEKNYLGIELEVNQKFFQGEKTGQIEKLLLDSYLNALQNF